MGRFMNACKAFIKAWQEPQAAELFLQGNLTVERRDEGDIAHLRLLALLQSKGRLIDFLKENIDSFDDAQVGAAVRNVHKECGKLLDEIVTLKPLIDAEEGQTIDVPKGYDATTIKMVGEIKGEPPYKGIIIHRGWRAIKRSLPKKLGEVTSDVVTPAEIEVSQR